MPANAKKTVTFYFSFSRFTTIITTKQIKSVLCCITLQKFPFHLFLFVYLFIFIVFFSILCFLSQITLYVNGGNNNCWIARARFNLNCVISANSFTTLILFILLFLVVFLFFCFYSVVVGLAFFIRFLLFNSIYSTRITLHRDVINFKVSRQPLSLLYLLLYYLATIV